MKSAAGISVLAIPYAIYQVFRVSKVDAQRSLAFSSRSFAISFLPFHTIMRPLFSSICTRNMSRDLLYIQLSLLSTLPDRRRRTLSNSRAHSFTSFMAYAVQSLLR